MGIKFIIVLFCLFRIDNLYACKMIDEDPVFTTPEKAQTVLIVRLDRKIKESKMLIFKSSPDWGGRTISVSAQDCMLYFNYKIDKLYLLYTSKTEEQFNKNFISFRNLIAIELDKVDAIIRQLYWLSNIQEIPKGRPNVFWGYCKDDDECTQTKNSCEENTGVNKLFKTNYDGYIEKNKFPKKCSTPIKNQRISKCVENFCS